MMELYDQWCRSETQDDALNAYLLVDAAQIQQDIDWVSVLEASKGRNLCWGYPEAEHPDVGVLLLKRQTAAANDLLKEWLKSYPFAFTSLFSDWPFSRLAKALHQRFLGKLTDGQTVFMRYADAAAMWRWQQVLEPYQLERLLAVAHVWQWVGRDGELQQLSGNPQKRHAYPEPILSKDQLAQLHHVCLPDRVEAGLRQNGYVPASVNHFALYQAIIKVAILLESIGLLIESRLYRILGELLPNHLNEVANDAFEQLFVENIEASKLLADIKAYLG